MVVGNCSFLVHAWLDGNHGKESDVGAGPFISPVPLKALQDYRLIRGCDSSVTGANIDMSSRVIILECVE